MIKRRNDEGEREKKNDNRNRESDRKQDNYAIKWNRQINILK